MTVSHTVEPAGASALEELLRNRRSVRHFQPQPVSRDLLTGLLELAVQAPSAHNSQPWRFVVLQDADLKRELARAMGAALRESRLADGDEVELVDADVMRSMERIESAPAAVLVCMTDEDLDVYPDTARAEAESILGVQSTALAAGQLLLAAHAAGLGACWVCAPLFSGEIVRKALDLPARWSPQALILMGYPRREGKQTTRRSLKEVVIWR